MTKFHSGEIVRHKVTGDLYEVVNDEETILPDQKITVHHQPKTKRGTRVMAKHLEQRKTVEYKKFYIQVHATWRAEYSPIQFAAMCRDVEHACEIAVAVSAANDDAAWDVDLATEGT